MGLVGYAERHAELKSARATTGFRFPKVLRIRTLPFKQWVWSSNLQRVTKKADTPPGYLLFSCPQRFEKSNAARMSAAADGWTEANLYFGPIPGVKMQTNLQRVTTTILYKLLFLPARVCNNSEFRVKTEKNGLA